MALASTRLVLLGLASLAPAACTYEALQLTFSLDDEGPADGDADPGDRDAPGDARAGDSSPGDPRGPGDLLPVGDTMPHGDPIPHGDLTPACLDPEGANSPGEASPIAPGTMGSLCTADQDWYRVSANPNDVLALSLTANPPVVVVVAVQLCSSGQAVGRCPAATANGAWRCEFRPESDGDLCVGLWLGDPNPHATTQYSLSAAVSQPLCVIDVYEENDARSNPYPAGFAPRTLDDAVLCPNDPDWFRIETSGGEEALLVEVQSYSPAPLLVDATVCTGTGTLADVVCRLHPAEEDVYQCAVHFATPLPAYCFEVFSDTPLGTDGAPYQLAVQGMLPCGDDPAEPNNHPASARPLAEFGGQPLQICDLDVDWFLVGPMTSTLASVNLVWHDPAHAIVLEAHWKKTTDLYAAPACPGITDDGDYRKLECNKPVTLGDTYLVRVYVVSAPAGADVTYSLSVTF